MSTNPLQLRSNSMNAASNAQTRRARANRSAVRICASYSFTKAARTKFMIMMYPKIMNRMKKKTAGR